MGGTERHARTKVRNLTTYPVFTTLSPLAPLHSLRTRLPFHELYSPPRRQPFFPSAIAKPHTSFPASRQNPLSDRAAARSQQRLAALLAPQCRRHPAPPLHPQAQQAVLPDPGLPGLRPLHRPARDFPSRAG
ncbi:hypothetical protein BC938DRAFT_475180 [Jimgerdemannia flammicorona]|uniref:Uncharacterized protein n=1 Tax=Jimgerdemannia flammicorona TaxID=994334 RepID=A0A433QRZ1_9FUNG|nr:hypothetical protein BC938DRAFT_475180 [Jimgerdemannia flammicorona]